MTAEWTSPSLGHVMDNIELTQPAVKYKEPMMLLRNDGARFC